MSWPLLASDLLGLAKLIALIFAIVTPVMTLLEGLRRADAFNRVARVLAPLLRVLRISAEGAFALLVGLFFGLSYGAGPLIRIGREGRIGPAETVRISVFLAVCHAIVEDTLLWVAVGANWLVLVPGRALFALAVTASAMALGGLAGGRVADRAAGS